MTIRLRHIDQSVIEAIESSGLERVVGARTGPCADLVREVVQKTRALVERSPREPRFGGYLALDDEGLVVGTCAFRTGPSAAGEVEIAYFTFPPYEGRGHATDMARGLIAIARAAPKVRRVFAHTLPERNASTRVLEKAGMRLRGPVEDPEDGMVWRWELDEAI